MYQANHTSYSLLTILGFVNDTAPDFVYNVDL